MNTTLIDVSAMESSEQLQKLLKNKLQFPDFYGENRNAFWDSITGLVEMPDKVEIRGWLHLLAAFPEDAALLLECLDSYNNEKDLKKIEILVT